MGPIGGEAVELRFFAELRDLLPRAHRSGRICHPHIPTQSVKDLIESYGVPHTEVDVIIAEGVSVGFDYRPRAGDHVGVYPVFESFDISPLLRLRPAPLRQTRFVLDGHLGTLARRLRLLGFDCRYARAATDEELVTSSVHERRILLTRDRGLLRRKAVTHGYLLRSDQPRAQVLEVVRRFQLSGSIDPFSRCPACNAELVPVAKADIAHRLPPLTRRHYHEFRSCPACGRDYWRGAHHRRLADLVAQARAADGSGA
ncbi:MAG: Mut7-C RNAse domain-containing protein [Chloroflexota bacterium]|jgi:uncharacterized protein with PIN domain